MPSYSQIQQITISGITNTGNPNAPAYLRKGEINTTYERLNKYNDAERTELLYYDESGQETTDPINPLTGEPTREIVPILRMLVQYGEKGYSRLGRIYLTPTYIMMGQIGN